MDLLIVSVLLDAGAGSQWVFSKEGYTANRSEGLALASFFLFRNSLSKNNYTVDI